MPFCLHIFVFLHLEHWGRFPNWQVFFWGLKPPASLLVVDDDCCSDYVDDCLFSWNMVKVSCVQVRAINMWRRQRLLPLQWQFPGWWPLIGCLQNKMPVHIYIYFYMNGICVITLVTILWLNQEPHTKWSICFRSQSPLGFKYVESICSDSGHCFWVKMNINIYIHTFWYDIILLYRYLHYMIASIIIHIHYWGMFFCTCTYWTTSPRINSCYHPPPK